jgi:hypothetical protein
MDVNRRLHVFANDGASSSTPAPANRWSSARRNITMTGRSVLASTELGPRRPSPARPFETTPVPRDPQQPVDIVGHRLHGTHTLDAPVTTT